MHEHTKERVPSQREKVLNALRNAGSRGVTNKELQEVSLRFSARLQELYMQGYVVNVIPTLTIDGKQNGINTYYLMSEPKEILNKPENATDSFVRMIEESLGSSVSKEVKWILDEANMYLTRKAGTHKKHARLGVEI